MSRYEELVDRLRAGTKIMIDGGTGTEVERRGVPQLENAWNGGGTLSHPEIVRAIHEDYVRHGAEIIISNTFATSRNVLEDAGVPELFEPYNRRAVELACEARTNTAVNSTLVAGGMSHWSFSGRQPSLSDLQDSAAHQAEIMKAAGADLIMLEMMIDIPKMHAVLEGALACGLPVWVGLSCAPDPHGQMCLQSGKPDARGIVQAGSSASLADAIRSLAHQNVPLLSIMHTDVEHIDECLDVVDENWDGLVGVYAHSGRFIEGKWNFEGTISVEDFVSCNQRWLDRRVHVFGGCCGIRPDHMAALRLCVDALK